MLCQIWFIQTPGSPRDRVQQALEEDGFRIVAFDGVAEAISRMADAHPPRMIVLCLISAALSAPTLALSLSQHPAWARVPVLGVNALVEGKPEAVDGFRGTVRLLCGEG
jgi:CheY-like chemotaxis protein